MRMSAQCSFHPPDMSVRVCECVCGRCRTSLLQTFQHCHMFCTREMGVPCCCLLCVYAVDIRVAVDVRSH